MTLATPSRVHVEVDPLVVGESGADGNSFLWSLSRRKEKQLIDDDGRIPSLTQSRQFRLGP